MAKSKQPVEELDFLYTPLSNSQKQAAELWRQCRILFFIGPAGVGKCQPLYSTVWTPTGPKKMGDIKIGETVCCPDGTISKVLAVYPQGKKTIYEIEFDTGDKVQCTEEHLWEVYDIRKKNPYVVSLKSILEDYKNKKGRRRYSIRVTNPIHFTPKSVTIDPYLIGLLLGDGCLNDPKLSFSSADAELLVYVSNLLPEPVKLKYTGRYDYRLSGDNIGKNKNPLLDQLRELELAGKNSFAKFIPELYKYNSEYIRLSVLQGLFDTDGTVTGFNKRKDIKTGCAVEYTTVSEQLARDVKEVAESLGATATIKEKKTSWVYKGIKKEGKAFRLYISFPVGFKPFRLQRKANLYQDRQWIKKRWIENIREVGEQECQCILIDHKDHLYITDNCIPTHNTASALGMALRDCLKTVNKEKHNRQKLWLSRPTVACDEDLGFFPGTLEEKLLPWLGSFKDCFSSLSNSTFEQLTKLVDIETIPVGMLRGRTISDGVLILDESQLMTYNQIKSAVTRLGRNSKIVFAADPTQSDLYPQQLSPIIEISRKLSRLDSVGVLYFDPTENLRDPLITSMLELI